MHIKSRNVRGQEGPFRTSVSDEVPGYSLLGGELGKWKQLPLTRVRWPVGSLKWNVLNTVVNALVAMGQLDRIEERTAQTQSSIGIRGDYMWKWNFRGLPCRY